MISVNYGDYEVIKAFDEFLDTGDPSALVAIREKKDKENSLQKLKYGSYTPVQPGYFMSDLIMSVSSLANEVESIKNSQSSMYSELVSFLYSLEQEINRDVIDKIALSNIIWSFNAFVNNLR